MVSKLNSDRKPGEGAGQAIGRIYGKIGFTGKDIGKVDVERGPELALSQSRELLGNKVPVCLRRFGCRSRYHTMRKGGGSIPSGFMCICVPVVQNEYWLRMHDLEQAPLTRPLVLERNWIEIRMLPDETKDEKLLT